MSSESRARPASERRAYPRPAAGVHPPPTTGDYNSSRLRHPGEPLVIIPHTLSELTGPAYPYGHLSALDSDLTAQHAAQPIGQRITLQGRVLDEDGRPVPNTLIEIWQANAAGRYTHYRDNNAAPLDPNFSGAGRTLTDSEGRWRFITIMPGAYPWPNHYNAWRPKHVHFSLFGQNFLTRLITQMYFPGDPLHALDPVLNSVPDPLGRERLICRFDIGLTEPNLSLGFAWDIVLRGRGATPMEKEAE
jgi:protocatechuate 3,4-dioxygenase, beta subunit